jgi:hypothetical protein
MPPGSTDVTSVARESIPPGPGREHVRPGLAQAHLAPAKVWHGDALVSP